MERVGGPCGSEVSALRRSPGGGEGRGWERELGMVMARGWGGGDTFRSSVHADAMMSEDDAVCLTIYGCVFHNGIVSGQ